VELPAMPRMADFARVLAALDDVTGWRTLAAYEATAADIAETVVESDLFAEAVRELVATEGSEARWEGTASELRERITPAKPPKWWPRNARAASGRLHRCAPSLRRVGVEVTFRRSGGSGARLIIIECADMKCELASHRHDRHAIPGDLPEHADANDIDPGACDANDGVTHDLTLNLLAGEVIDSAEPSSPLETGPCTHCGQPCHRYGDRGNPLCDDCQEGQ